MGRFDTIKASIDANIKENGNQEITGQKMNSVLTEMVNATDAELAKLERRVLILESLDGGGNTPVNGAYLPLTGGNITGSLYVTGVVESRTLSVDSIIYLKGDNAYHSIHALSTGDLSINSNKVLKVTTNGGMTIDGYEAIHAGNIGNYLSGGSTGGGGTVSGNYLPLTGGDINGSLNVKNILSVGVNGHSLSEQNDGSMLIQPQGNLLVLATGYDIDFAGDTFNFNGSPVVTEETIQNLLPSGGGSVSGNYLPLTGGDITGDLSIDGVLSVGGNAIKTIDGKLCLYSNFALNILVEGEGANINGAQIIHVGNLGRYLEELGYTGGGSSSGIYLPLTGGTITGNLFVNGQLHIGNASIYEDNDGAATIFSQSNIMVLATGYDIDFAGDNMFFNGSPVVTEDSLSGLLPSGGSGSTMLLLRINTESENKVEYKDATGTWVEVNYGTLQEAIVNMTPAFIFDPRPVIYGESYTGDMQALVPCSLSRGLIWGNASIFPVSQPVVLWQKGSKYSTFTVYSGVEDLENIS